MPSTGRPSAIAPAVPRAGAGRFRIAFNDAWRGVTRKEIAWTLAIGLAFTVAHAYSFGSKFRSWPFLILPSEWAFIPHCLVLLIVLRMAEHPQLASIPQWRRYAVAVPSAVLLLGLTATSWDIHSFR